MRPALNCCWGPRKFREARDQGVVITFQPLVAAGGSSVHLTQAKIERAVVFVDGITRIRRIARLLQASIGTDPTMVDNVEDVEMRRAGRSGLRVVGIPYAAAMSSGGLASAGIVAT